MTNNKPNFLSDLNQNATNNNTTTNKEEIIMTLTKDLLREELKKYGVELSNTVFKKTKRDDLIKMLEEKQSGAITVPAGDMSSDKYYPEQDIALTDEQKKYIIKRLYYKSFKVTKGDNKGKRIVLMRRLYGIIKGAYDNNNNNIEESIIKNVINMLVKDKYLTYKKYESGAIVFFPTVKVQREYK